MKKIAIVMGLLLTTAAAHAGRRSNLDVTISTSSASGSLGSARNSVDSLQYVNIFTVPGLVVVAMRDAAGQAKTCTTTDPELIAIARSASGDSQIQIQWDATGKCTLIAANTASFLAPKAP